MTTKFRYEKCPVCGAVLPFHESHELALEHLMACAKKVAEGAPEVADVDQLELENHEGNLFGGSNERKT